MQIQNKNTDVLVGKGEYLYTDGGRVNLQQFWRFLSKLEIELPYDPTIPLLDIHPKHLYPVTEILAHLYLLLFCLQEMGSRINIDSIK